MKNTSIFVIMICIAMIGASVGITGAESIFLKDGSIVEGRIIHETDSQVTLTVANKEQAVARGNIIRIQYNDDYKKKVYIYLDDDSEIEGYIVAEDKNFYQVRKDLNSSAETSIAKTEVESVMKSKKKKDGNQQDNRFRRVCGQDIKNLCKGVKSGKGRIKACLLKQQEKLSEPCKKFFND